MSPSKKTGSASLRSDPIDSSAFLALDTVLQDFGLSRAENGSSVTFIGGVPPARETESHNINLSLVGAIPALANAIAATQIFEARGGQPQTIQVDLRKSHNYLDPDTGMTPTLNGQVGIVVLTIFMRLTANSTPLGDISKRYRGESLHLWHF